VAWRQIGAFRSLAVHRYFGVDWAVVWKIAQHEVPLLEQQAMATIRAGFPTWRIPMNKDRSRSQRPVPGRPPDRIQGTEAAAVIRLGQKRGRTSV